MVHAIGTRVIMVGTQPTDRPTVAHSILRGFRHGIIVAVTPYMDTYKYRILEETERKWTVEVTEPHFTVLDES